MSALLDPCLEDVRDSVSYRTCLNHECIVRLHLNLAISAKRLARLSPKDIHGLYEDKLTEDLSRRRIRKIQRYVNLALKDAVRWRHISPGSSEGLQAILSGLSQPCPGPCAPALEYISQPLRVAWEELTDLPKTWRFTVR